MVKLTKNTVDKIADAMVSYPRDQMVLYETGEVGIERGGRYIKLRDGIDPIKTKEPKELWRKDVIDLVELVNPKLKYKTHLSKYLYQELNSKLQGVSKPLTGNKKIDDILKSAKYQEYLTHELIDLERYVNNEREIKISAEATSFANHTLKPFYTKEELLALHEEARQLAVNDTRASIDRGYRHRTFINEDFDRYQNAYRAYHKDFKLLGELWAWKIAEDGIRVGYSQDDIFNKILLPVEFRVQKMGYNQNVMRQMERLVFDLKETIKKSQDERIVKYRVGL